MLFSRKFLLNTLIIVDTVRPFANCVAKPHLDQRRSSCGHRRFSANQLKNSVKFALCRRI